ncbi:MAG: uracil-xanthine permease family protein [Halobacteriales archaeon]
MSESGGGGTAVTDGGAAQSDFVEYGIEDRPPLLQSILLGFQHYLTMIGATVAIPLVLISFMNEVGEAMPEEEQALLIGTFFVVSGIATLLQTTIGNRYPLVQGGTFSMLAPAIAIIFAVGGQQTAAPAWEVSLLELQGAIIVAGAVEVFIGYAGLMGRLKEYLSPVVIAPVIALIGLALFGAPQIVTAQQNWWLMGLTVLLIVLFSQYLDKYNRTFKLYPVLLGVGLTWLIALILSIDAVGFYEAGQPGYVDLDQAADADIIQVVTPLQWGMPQFTVSFIIGMFAGMLASVVESFGDYHAVARLSGTAAPSRKRINHGLGMEGIGNVIAGIMGTGNGSTSYSENIGAIGITGVASRYVVQVGAIVMLIAGFIGPVGMVFATLPEPIVGGLFIAMFGQIAAVGLANLKYVDLDSSRNVFIIGLALFAGLAVPAYMGLFSGPDEFRAGMEATWLVGSVLGEQIISDTIFVIGSTGMAVGGIIAFVLDITVKGSRESRGLADWDRIAETDEDFESFFDRLG